MVNIEIDGKKVKAAPGSMIIEVADLHDVYIPRFCYHKKLSVAANCRMCLVEVSNIPKPVPACATPIAEGMVVSTQSEIARDAQKSVMEFLLINHPLDCPICDQGGECELQDIAVGYGGDSSRYEDAKRVAQDKDIGPLISTEMTRCIHCTRCVRFGSEVAGVREMGMLGRGETAEIGTFIGKSVESEVSANIIDLCPVGALTAKPSRYSARAWELKAHPGIAPHDCLGSNIEFHIRNGKVMRVVPKENEAINEVWLSDRDRFSYQALNDTNRLQQPMIKENGQWNSVDWQVALERVVGNLNAVLQKYGADSLGALISSSATLEEMFLAQKLMRQLGSNNIDHRLKQMDFKGDDLDDVFPELGCELADLENLEATLLVGSNLRKEQPLAAIRLRKSTQAGQVFAINQTDYPFNFKLAANKITPASDFAKQLAGILKAAVSQNSVELTEDWVALLNTVESDETHQKIAQALISKEKAAIIFGAIAQSHQEFSTLRNIARKLSEVTGASFGRLTTGANSAGGYLAGAVPHRDPLVLGHDLPAGKNVQQMLSGDMKALLLMNVEPEKDTLLGETSLEALKSADFVVAFSSFADGKVKEYADIMLPIAAFAETSGSFVNVNGTMQSFTGAVAPIGEARPLWKVLRVLGNFMELPGYEYTSSEDILTDMEKNSSTELKKGASKAPKKLESFETHVSEVNIYQVDALVRHSTSLQATVDGLAVNSLA